VFSPEEVAEMRAEWDRLRGIEGELCGHEVHIEPGAPRLSNLFNKSPAFDRLLACQPTLAAAHHLLGEIRVYSLNGRNPLKGEGQQLLHSDVPRGRRHRLANRQLHGHAGRHDARQRPDAGRAGLAQVVPINVPDVNMAEVKEIVVTPDDRRTMPSGPTAPQPDEVKVTGKAGSVAVINGHVWHGGTRNQSGAPRGVLHLANRPPQHSAAAGRARAPQPELLERSSPAQRYLLDIEGAEPKVFGYPPLPKEVRTWTAVEGVDAPDTKPHCSC
jgi:hypothetical protein